MIYDYSIIMLIIFLRITIINIATSNIRKYESEGVIAAKSTRLFKTAYKLANSLLQIYTAYYIKYGRKRYQRQFVTFHREFDLIYNIEAVKNSCII